MEELDPTVFGVIVEDESGSRRGLLLPDIPGIDDVEQQVEIAARKAGIPHGEPSSYSDLEFESSSRRTQAFTGLAVIKHVNPPSNPDNPVYK